MGIEVRAHATWSQQQVWLCYFFTSQSRHRCKTEKLRQCVTHVAFHSPVYNESISYVKVISILLQTSQG